MRWQDYGFTAKKSKAGWMYILPMYKNVPLSEMIKNQHWVEEARDAINYCNDRKLNLETFDPKHVFLTGVSGKRQRKSKTKETGIFIEILYYDR